MGTSEAFIENSTFFDPSAERAQRLDARMRERLGDSLRYVIEQATGHISIDQQAAEDFFTRLAQGPVSPQVFGAYYELVLAFDDDAPQEAESLLAEIFSWPSQAPGLRISELADPATSRESDRYSRLVDTDPTMPFDIFPPSREEAKACRDRISAALQLMDEGNPELAAEIRALIREIILAVGPADRNAVTFDGASSFMLWGAVVLNAASHETTIEMVQALAHESAHNLLFGLCTDGSLVENEDDERFDSPLRTDPRPMDGIYHATFVTARMHQAIQRLIDSGVLQGDMLGEATAALAVNVDLFDRGIETVKRHARLTPLGRAVMDGARRYMDGAASR